MPKGVNLETKTSGVIMTMRGIYFYTPKAPNEIDKIFCLEKEEEENNKTIKAALTEQKI